MPRPDAYRLAHMLLLAATAALYGVRHGIDWDHLAAITGCFIGGIAVSNAAVALAATFGYLNASRSFRAYAAVAAANAAASTVIGVFFLTGRPLPALLGG